jgi:hypothetical protein
MVYFADPVNCRDYLIARRWPDGVACPRCGSKDVQFQEEYCRWRCRSKHDAPQFTLRTGTMMEDSPLSLDKWLVAMWQIVNCTGYLFPSCPPFQKKVCNMMGKRLHADCQLYDVSYPKREPELAEFEMAQVTGGLAGLKLDTSNLSRVLVYSLQNGSGMAGAKAALSSARPAPGIEMPVPETGLIGWRARWTKTVAVLRHR